MFVELWSPRKGVLPLQSNDLTIAQVLGSYSSGYVLDTSPFEQGVKELVLFPGGVEGTWVLQAKLSSQVLIVDGLQANFVREMPLPNELEALYSRLMTLRRLRDRYLPKLHHQYIKQWAVSLGDGFAGYVQTQDAYEGNVSWLTNYFRSVAPGCLLHDNLAIHAAMDDDPLPGIEILGTLDVPPGLGFLPLTTVAPWLPEALEWMVGEDGDEPRSVTGAEVLRWIMDREGP